MTAQVRYQRYNFDQVRMGAFLGHNYDADWFFFSPRIGVNYQVNRNLSAFANFAVSSRTPTDVALYDANDPYVLPSFEVVSVNSDSTVYVFGDPTARSERVYDIEVGGEYREQDYAVGVNLFWMRFEDEILPYGGLDEEGNAITINADRSIHAGVELSGTVQPTDWLTLDGNFSYNHNRINKFTPNIDGFNIDFADKTVPGFPDFVGNIVVDLHYANWRFAMRNRFIGKQYMELQNIDSLTIDDHYTASVSLSYSVKDFLKLGNLTFTGRIDNLFDKQYLSGGYGGNYAYDDGTGNVIVGGWAEYYVAAERSFYGQVKLEMF
jgi:iron complex outermembrane receptor protein